MNHETHELPLPIRNKHFALKNHILRSRVLKNNPLGDTNEKHNFVIEPLGAKGPLPLIVHLSGYFGNGPQSFNLKTLEESFPETLMKLMRAGEIPVALHVFVDAMTSVGGSQFINSEGCGDYSDYIQKELIPSLHKEFKLKKESESCCVMGTSSGGYGALHHISVPGSAFGHAIAIAPDSYFPASLLPDYYKLAPFMSDFSEVRKIGKILSEGLWQKKKNFFSVMNAVAMTLCYSRIEKGKIQFPIDPETGVLREKIWQHIQRKDPIYFLAERVKNLKGKNIHLEVGSFDEFSLYFGARQIRGILKTHKINHHFEEFAGGHFGLTDRKISALKRLKSTWMSDK
jgi:enterochelin esterase-like enzyme